MRSFPFFLCLSLLFWQGSSQNQISAQEDPKPKLQRYEISKPLMGVKFRLVVYAPNIELARQGLIAAVERIAELEECLSDYDPDSEISKLARNAKPDVPVQVSEDLMNVLLLSEEIHTRSAGSFDPTVAPLSKLWRVARREKKLPENAAIERSKQKVGWDHLRLDKSKRTVTFCRSGMELDFGGIAKGYAADEAIRILEKNKLPRSLVDAGGDVTVGDPPPEKKGWSIAISDKEGERLTLANASVATSGDRYQYIEHEGKRYSHIIDPRTGWGITNRRLVTIVCKGKNAGASADGWASALSVMPYDVLKNKASTLDLTGIKIEFVGKSDDPKSRQKLLTHGLLAK